MTTFKNTKPNRIRHKLHVVQPSFWPFCASWALFFVTASLVNYFNDPLCTLTSKLPGSFYVNLSVFLLLVILFFWFRDIIFEAESGFHSEPTQKMLIFGFKVFVVSEVMFFCGFFWAYFHLSLNPSIFIGNVWPPKTIKPISPLGLPLFNTALLLYSGFFIHKAHKCLVNCKRMASIINVFITLFLGVFFLAVQLFEYT